MILKDLASKFETTLTAIYENDESHAIFLIALQHVLGYNRSAYLLKKEEILSDLNLRKLENILEVLETGKPIQYILGETYFYGLQFKVDESVLIPRPETEELVEWILQVCNHELGTNTLDINCKSKIQNILDIGTGSGCIAIALKKNLPKYNVYGWDISKDALAIAKQNALVNSLDVVFKEVDILAPLNASHHIKYSVIVSNPPYITPSEMQTMHHNVLANEPHLALFVKDENPLLFYDVIADFALKNLEEDGLLFFEINEYLGKQTTDLLIDKGFVNIYLKKDMQGKFRMICCSK